MMLKVKKDEHLGQSLQHDHRIATKVPRMNAKELIFRSDTVYRSRAST